MLALKQDPDVSKKASEYIIYFMPALLMQGLYDIDRNFLTSIDLAEKAFLVFVIAPFFHGAICYYFTITLMLGVRGLGIAGFITNVIILIA